MKGSEVVTLLRKNGWMLDRVTGSHLMEGEVKVEYSAVFTREENGLYSVEFPNLPGCVTDGESRADAVSNARGVDAPASQRPRLVSDRGGPSSRCIAANLPTL